MTTLGAIPTQAVIYCRVSSDRQAKEGDGARSQEQRCRSYAQMMGYTVPDVFTDDGVSGALIDRPAIQKMLLFLRSQPDEIVVIIDDISRIARDVMAHFQLKAALRAAGGRLESPSFQFGESASDELLETIMAATAQYGRNGNREQVLNRMRSRLESGYWTFPTPIGYLFEKHPLHKKIMVPSRVARSILGPALEDFGTGRLQTQRELGLHLQEQGFFHDIRPASTTVLEKRVSRMMELLPLYAGFLEYKDWKIDRRAAQHEPILSPLGLARIEERLYKKVRPIGTVRADTNMHFPLRNFIRCAGCGRPLTGSLAKREYPRYHCYYQKCPKHGHSYSSKKIIEPAFKALLQEITPTPELVNLLQFELRKTWSKNSAEQKQATTSLEQELSTVQKEIQGFIRRLGRVSDSLAEEIEREVGELKLREIEVRRRMEEAYEPTPNFHDVWKTVHTYFEHPLELWESGSSKDKQALLRMVFTTAPTFDLKNGLNTCDLSLPYRVSRNFWHSKEGVVEVTGESWHQIGEHIRRWAEWIS
jgi:site-specific DNA recombinase